ncbi:alpha/beta fold hydrolase [Bradyrhizobium japonicum]|uniref:alpha/beta fold hydrolase n=1 Tax=Bradyrhizobium japonicum TaxID=375 RepID=UPI00042A8132|nr:alpha/beta hydrolase [Bradyrhizobium japonicum]
MSIAISTDGGKIFYQASSLVAPWREPAGVVLMHHGVALTGDAWCDWQPALLAAGFRVIRLDMRGFGRSEPTPEGYGWSLPNFFADIDVVLAAENVDTFHYVGESLGGLIGLGYAARYPERIRSCALLSTPFDGKRIKAVDTWRATIDKGGMAAWSDALMPMRFADGDVDPRLYAWVHRLQAECAPSAVYEQAEFIKTQDLSSQLDQIRAPVLILAPDGSPFVDRSLAADLHARLKTSEIQWFPGQRHSLLLSRAGECASACVDFIKRRL